MKNEISEEMKQRLAQLKIECEQRLREYDVRVRQERLEKLKGSVCLNCDACVTIFKLKNMDKGAYFCGLDGKSIEDEYSCCSEWKRKDPEKPSDRFNKNEAYDKFFKRWAEED